MNKYHNVIKKVKKLDQCIDYLNELSRSLEEKVWELQPKCDGSTRNGNCLRLWKLNGQLQLVKNLLAIFREWDESPSLEEYWVRIGVTLCHDEIKDYLCNRMEEVKEHYPISLYAFLDEIISDVDDVADRVLEAPLSVKEEVDDK